MAVKYTSTLRSIFVQAHVFEENNDFLHQVVDGSIRRGAEQNSSSARLSIAIQ